MNTKKKGIGKWIVIAVVAIVIIAAAMGNTGENDSEKIGTVQDTSRQTAADNKDSEPSGDEGQSDSSTKAGGEDLSDTENEDSSNEEEKSGNEEEKSDNEEESGRYHPGDIVSYGDFEITYKSVGKYKSNNQFIQPKKGFQYLKFDFTFKNVGDTDTLIGSFDCYADGEKCDQEYISDDGGDFLLEKLSSGRKTSGSVVFEVPKSAKMKDIELEYENYSFLSDEKVVFLAK